MGDVEGSRRATRIGMNQSVVRARLRARPGTRQGTGGAGSGGTQCGGGARAAPWVQMRSSFTLKVGQARGQPRELLPRRPACRTRAPDLLTPFSEQTRNTRNDEPVCAAPLPSTRREGGSQWAGPGSHPAQQTPVLPACSLVQAQSAAAAPSIRVTFR